MKKYLFIFAIFLALVAIFAYSAPKPIQYDTIELNLSSVSFMEKQSTLTITNFYNATHYSLETPGSMVIIQDYYKIREIPENGKIDLTIYSDVLIINYWAKLRNGGFHLLWKEAYQ